MSSAASQPELRLTGFDDDTLAWRKAEHARLAVIKENRIAAHAGAMQPHVVNMIDARDPRWILAMQTKARLQGATLTPERREVLMQRGTQLGLRPFETNLIIAIVQDQARQGQPTQAAASPLLSMLGAASSQASIQPAVWPKWFAAFAAAAAIVAVLIRWLGA